MRMTVAHNQCENEYYFMETTERESLKYSVLPRTLNGVFSKSETKNTSFKREKSFSFVGWSNICSTCSSTWYCFFSNLGIFLSICTDHEGFCSSIFLDAINPTRLKDKCR
eukprot:gb/GECG01007870.1/.p1 GENE.gb/GECG01007870.1/~~gb/GECG01007870.1/.p1  ORF type:complete len:110 (+),score=4.15 gb/GECG01007870.1/:1-330(+)